MLESLSGKILDVGPKPSGISSERFYREPDNLYTLRPEYKEESVENIVSEDLIFATKFHRILLKEWINFCKVGGSVGIAFREREGRDLPFLRSEVFTLFGNSVEFEWQKDGERVTAVMRKLKPVLSKGDTIDRWTFGVITNGKKDEQVDRIIGTMQEQDVKEHEIIVCGKYSGKKKSEVKLIPFEKKDDKGWITKKKNLLSSEAKYQNIAIVHDRIFLSKNWHSGMRRYGNYFEALTCSVNLESEETRMGDWVTMGFDLNTYGYRSDDAAIQRALDSKYWQVGLLEYRDWDTGAFVPGFVNIFKKRVWERHPWNESLFWNEREDIELSASHHRGGVVMRANPHSVCYTNEFRFAKMPVYSFDSLRLGKLNLPASYKPTRRFLNLTEKALDSPLFAKLVTGYFGVEGKSPSLKGLRKKLVKTGISEVYVSSQNIDSIKDGAELELKPGVKVEVTAVRQKTKEFAIFDAKDSAGSNLYRARQSHGLIVLKYEGRAGPDKG